MKRLRAEATKEIAIPAEALWATIEKMTGMENWYPDLISESSIEESGDETLRFCTMADGGKLEERVLIRDRGTRTFVYAIDIHPLPATNIVGTLRVDDLNGTSKVTWDAQFTVEDAAAEQTVAMINGMYAAGLDSLAAFHNA